MIKNQSGGCLVWLRRDLRLTDNAAIAAALTGAPSPVHVAFIFDSEILGALPTKSDRRVEFIHDAVSAIDDQLRQSGGGLHSRHGDAPEQIVSLAISLNCQRVIAARDYEPAAIQRDKRAGDLLAARGIVLELVSDHVIFERDDLLTGSGKPYTVYTPYKKKWLASLQASQLEPFNYELAGRLAKDNAIGPIPSLDSMGFSKTNLVELGITATETAAARVLREFSSRIERYQEQRDYPAVRGVSYLSVHLRFGTISIRQAARLALQTMQASPDNSSGAAVWLSELIWRDFYFQIIYHFPYAASRAFKPIYDRIQWEDDMSLYDAWCQGRTGYPLVDAAMRQINETGYMHNRLRMVVASFLTKDLGISWQLGEKYFADNLNDFDLAANNGGWQWASSSGCDSQPYFRIFNPVTQSQRFDPNGKFIRRYLPVLAQLTDKQIHAPWLLDPLELSQAGITLGKNYSQPIVIHAEARQRTLERYQVVKSGG